jgi:Ca2+-binding EF-hand superfamily protein
MPPTAIRVARRFRILVCLLAHCAATDRAAAGVEQDQYEEKVVARGVERAVRVAKSDRGMWVKELDEAFPDKVGNPLKEEEYAAWFKLLAGEAAEWRRDGSPSTALAGLFDRIVQRLELGPVPSVKRDEFLRYAKKALVPGNPQSGDGEQNEDVDKVFRVLDRDGDGKLEPEEMTTKLREEKPRADTDGNGRIDKDEYRTYFRQRVVLNTDAAIKAMDQLQKLSADGKTPAKPGVGTGGLPSWFTDLDTDKDAQIALSEWRKSGREIAAFMEMDLDDDGLLTKDEYARFAKMKEREAAAKEVGKKIEKK